MRRRDETEPQIICLSAVIGDLNNFESWIGGRLLKRTERPVPLDEGLLLGDGRFRYLAAENREEKIEGPVVQPQYSGKNSSQDLIIPMVQWLSAEGEQVIIFRQEKGQTLGCARYLARELPHSPASDALERLPTSDPSQSSILLRDVLQYGVCFHNADLSPEERQIVEEEFRKENSQIKAIAATTTLAMGVNTPATAVIIAGLMHPLNKPYSVAEYKNLAGRAGRLGFSERGMSYLIAQDGRKEHQYWEQYVTAEPEDLRSRFLQAGTDPRSLIVRVLVAAERASGIGVSADDITEFLEESFGAFQEKRRSGSWQWNKQDLANSLSELQRFGLVEIDSEGRYRLQPLGRITGETATEVSSIVRLVACLRPLSPNDITDPVLLTAAQTTKELNEVTFPINKKSTQKEPGTWFGELRRIGIVKHVLDRLGRDTKESYEEGLRAKKAAACLLFISGREMRELESKLTQHGGSSRGAAGPIRSIAGRTCDLIPTTARVAEILHPELDFGDRIERLAVRLNLGVTGKMVELARTVGTKLGRGDYGRLEQAGLLDADSIEEADDETILRCVDDAAEKLDVVRSAAKALKQDSANKVTKTEPILEPYEQ